MSTTCTLPPEKDAFLKHLALIVTVAAGVFTMYHLYFQLQLTKQNLKKAQAEEKTVESDTA